MAGWRDARAWAPAVVAVACLGGVALGRLDKVPRPAGGPVHRVPQMSDEGRALLGGIDVGDRIVGWTVQGLDGPVDGELRVELARDDVIFAVTIAPLERRAELPPLQTERYAMFYGRVYPAGTVLPANTIRATTAELARRLRAHEETVEVPGL